MTAAPFAKKPPGVRRRASYTGIYAFMVSVTMLFAAFTSALIVRRGGAKDWQPVPMPHTLYVSTSILAVSSAVAEKARRDLRTGDRHRFSIGWTIATVLGCGFLVSQIVLWNQLRAAGLYVGAHAGSAFFWVGTVAHALHLAGGLIAFLYLDYRALKLELGPSRRTAVDVATVYWHFLGVLWIYLLGLFWFFGR